HHGSFPYTNVVLIGLCCLMFLYQLAVGGVGFLTGGGGVEAQVFFLKWGFIPEELIRSQPYSTIVTEQGVTLSIETPLPTWVTIFRPCSCTAGSALRRKYDVPVGVRG
ncbi:MAG: hypothetical protein MK125_14850, partial [Dehalococcoidia bacterium]|nr:hypothetical protein [Dehalococcoidia bacterium]